MRRIAIACLAVSGCYEGVGGSGRDSESAGATEGEGTAGSVGETEDESGGDTEGEDPPATFGPSPTRRLAAFEYENTLRALFGDEAVDAAAPALATLPTDRNDDLAFSTMALGVTATHVEAYYRVADMVASFVAAEPARRSLLRPCLGDAAPTDACVRDFIAELGSAAWRRPLDDSEIDGLATTWSEGKAVSVEDGLAIVLVELLVAPEFLYRPEIGGEPTDDGLALRLDGFELATRLSYLAWGAPPDAALRDAAADGSIDDDELVAQIDRVFDDPRAVAHVQRFVEQWLDVDRLPSVQQSAAFLDGIDPSELAEDMRAEVDAFVHTEVFERESNWADLFTSRRAEIGSDALAAVYGVAGVGEVELPARRAGLLGRAALLLGSGESTHPIKRGAFVARELLCTTIAPPDPDAFPPNAIEPPPFDPTKTARERWTEKTSAAGCAACHAIINPYGFALENFDPIGRWRDEEPILDPDTGEVVAELPIDANVGVLVGDGQVMVEGAAGLGAALGENDMARECLARQWLRFSLGREEVDDDDPLIDDLTASLAETETSVLAVLEQLARAPQFRFRKLEGQ